MKKAVHILGLFLAAVSFLAGFIDMFTHYQETGEFAWRIPLILMGAGVGLPLVIFSFYPATEEDGERLETMSEERYAQVMSERGGFMGSGGSGDSGAEGDYSGSSDFGGSD